MPQRRSFRWPPLAILAVAWLAVAPVGILAQSSNATCQSSFSWMDNSEGQTPCTVGAYLQGVCHGGQFTVNSLPPNSHYTGPLASEQNPCQCSTVTYNALSACGVCQGATIIGWRSWSYNCTTLYPGVFPEGIPGGTAVPAWAFQDVVSSDQFNATLAQLEGDSPESTATSSQSTATALPTSNPSASITASPSGPLTTSSSAPSSSGSKTGAIAGGVVGGVAGVALIAGVAVFFVMRKRRSQIPPSARFSAEATSSAYLSPGYAGAPSFATQMGQPRLYDPSDPSTFPTSPPPGTITSGSTNTHSFTMNPSVPSVFPGNYRGAPEI